MQVCGEGNGSVSTEPVKLPSANARRLLLLRHLPAEPVWNPCSTHLRPGLPLHLHLRVRNVCIHTPPALNKRRGGSKRATWQQHRAGTPARSTRVPEGSASRRPTARRQTGPDPCAERPRPLPHALGSSAEAAI
eukprot:363986-Chlamydomonas_euryale.AAC.7